MRIACGVEYSGTGYYGWQRQAHQPLTIQTIVEHAIAKIANHPVVVVAAGRTDRGVHATQQVIHFDTDSQRSIDNWLLGVNHYLPKDIRIVWVKPVADTFHARFKAKFRRYCYLIHATQQSGNGLYFDKVAWDYRTFNVAIMHEAAQYLVGIHDFSTFRGAACQARHPQRHVHFIRVTARGALIIVDIQANGFLYHMVRNIAGVLMAIGAGQQSLAWCRTILESKNRCLATVTAPARGLYFIQAGYPSEYDCLTEPRWPFLGLL